MAALFDPCSGAVAARSEKKKKKKEKKGACGIVGPRLCRRHRDQPDLEACWWREAESGRRGGKAKSVCVARAVARQIRELPEQERSRGGSGGRCVLLVVGQLRDTT
jgi:hypothetical protein